jgi:hypothetical protein
MSRIQIKFKEIFGVQEYEEGLVKIYLDKFMSLAGEVSKSQDISRDIENAVRECTEHLAIVVSSTEIGNLRHLAGRIKLFMHLNQQPNQQLEQPYIQPNDYNRTLNEVLQKVVELLEARIAEIEK